MAIIADWLRPPDFIGAARAGASIGLSQAEMHQRAAEHAAELALKRDELSASMSRAAAEREQAGKENDAAMALKQSALQQAGLLGGERIKADRDIADIKSNNAADALRYRQGVADNRNLNRNFQNLFKERTANDYWGVGKYAADEKQRIADEKLSAAEALKNSPERLLVERNRLAGLDNLGDVSGVRDAMTSAIDAKLTNSVPAAAALTTSTGTSSPSKEAQGGYKIGSKYAGLTYLGGDPNDENNWQ
jgi:hypothetical protein